MRKCICLILSILMFLCILSVAACSSMEEITQKSTIDPDPAIPLNTTIVDTPDQDETDAQDFISYIIYPSVPEETRPSTSESIGGESGVNGTHLNFGYTIPNSYYSDFVEYLYSDGDTARLTIENCLWAPHSFDLEVGIVNFRTGEHWTVDLFGGSITNRTITFRNLTTGHYSVTVRHQGTSALTSGYMRYTLN